MFADYFLYQRMYAFFKVVRTFQNIRKLPELFRNNGVKNDIRPGNGHSGSEHTELEFIAGKGKGRGPVPVGGILGEIGQRVDPCRHDIPFFWIILCAAFNCF